MPMVYLGLGSNLHKPRRQLARALKHLRDLPRTCLQNRSKIYRTTPFGVKAQPHYLNMVIGLKTSLAPHVLYRLCKDIEHKQRRIHKKTWGSRSIDIDVLLYGQRTIRHQKLNIPHPHLTKRDFVIVPLLELAPDQCLPNGEQIFLTPSVPQTIVGCYK